MKKPMKSSKSAFDREPCKPGGIAKTSLKDWPKVYRKLRSMRSLDEHEKILFARFAAATPDERWRMNVSYLRSLGLWGRSTPKASVSR